jgi:hypothetical protein
LLPTTQFVESTNCRNFVVLDRFSAVCRFYKLLQSIQGSVRGGVVIVPKHEDSIGNFSMWSVVRVGACQLCGRLATTGLCMRGGSLLLGTLHYYHFYTIHTFFAFPCAALLMPPKIWNWSITKGLNHMNESFEKSHFAENECPH